MSDALLSPAIGGTMWAAAGAAVARSARRIGGDTENRKVPLMGVLAAFVFAGQMVNFTIPGTGSSGHLGGGLILAILLGPHAAFISMASILTIQALFFADGGLLALGCNMFNLGFFPMFIAYPLLYRPLAGSQPTAGRLTAAAMAAAVIGLQFGALAVVLQTVLSGHADLNFRSFASLMIPIHSAIGIVEGAVTAAVVTFVLRFRPEILAGSGSDAERAFSFTRADRVTAAAVLAATVALSWFASANPDGLEWSMIRASDSGEIASPRDGVHRAFREVQDGTAVLPDYELPGPERKGAADPTAGAGRRRPDPLARTVSGLVGGVLSLLLAMGAALIVKRRRSP